MFKSPASYGDLYIMGASWQSFENNVVNLYGLQFIYKNKNIEGKENNKKKCLIYILQ